MSDDRPVEETYKKLSQYEHILSRADTYVGSLEFQKEKLWVFNEEEKKLEYREVSYVPGLFKIFDEILVNAADNYQNDKSMTYIKVKIDREKNTIKVKKKNTIKRAVFSYYYLCSTFSFYIYISRRFFLPICRNIITIKILLKY